MYSQDKTQAYYNSHENEILTDARAAFRAGRYERSAELCRWHYIIVGDRSADSLRQLSERCATLASSMDTMKEEGKLAEARAVAEELLAANSEDKAARKFLEELDAAASAPPAPTVPAPDTVKVESPVEIPIVQEEEPEPVQIVEPEPEPAPQPEPVKDTEPEPVREPEKPSANRFVIKGGVTLLKQEQFTAAPGIDIGFYDIGGAPIGVDAGVSFCKSLSDGKASMFEGDAALVFRAAKGIYPKVGVGFFSCQPSDGGDATHGLCAGAGISFLLGGHFCVEAGVKYYPKVLISGTQVVSTSGASYNFPVSVEVLSGGIAPTVKLGWAF